MKIINSITIAALILVGCYTNNPEIKSQKAAVENLLKAQVAAWNAGNINGFMDGYFNDSSMQFISKKGVRKGWQKTRDAYKKHYPTKDSMGKLIFELDSIEFLDPAAQLGHVTGKWKLVRQNDTPSGYFSLITRYTKEGPKIIIDHTW